MDSERDVIGGGGEDRVEQAARAMREAKVPTAPAGLMEKAILRAGAGAGSGEVGAARAAPEKKGSQERGWWSMKMVRRTAVAAGLAVVVGSAVVLAPWGGGTRVAFADVVEQVKAAHVVRCKVDVVVKLPGQNPQSTTLQMLMSEDGLANMNLGKSRAVIDEATGKMMLIDDEHKTVMVMDQSGGKGGGAAAAPNLLTQFKEMTGEGKPLGEKEIGGRKARGFLVEKGKKVFEVWADEGTEKPVLVVMKMAETMAPALECTFREFEWDPKDVAVLAKFEVPAGYHESKTTMNVSPAEEKDVVGALPVLGGFNDGVLPEEVDMVSVLQAVRTWAEKQGNLDTKAAQDEMMQRMMPVGRAWAFMSDEGKGTEWMYGGKGVKVGEKGRAVLWYRPVGKAGWRVIDADGAVHDETAEPAGGEKVRTNAAALVGAATQRGK